jgi:hypothetical protein
MNASGMPFVVPKFLGGSNGSAGTTFPQFAFRLPSAPQMAKKVHRDGLRAPAMFLVDASRK